MEIRDNHEEAHLAGKAIVDLAAAVSVGAVLDALALKFTYVFSD